MVLDPTELPQRRLAQELRFAIDDWLRTGRQHRVHQLCMENPKGVASTHVRYALGARRRAALERFPYRPKQEEGDGR